MKPHLLFTFMAFIAFASSASGSFHHVNNLGWASEAHWTVNGSYNHQASVGANGSIDRVDIEGMTFEWSCWIVEDQCPPGYVLSSDLNDDPIMVEG